MGKWAGTPAVFKVRKRMNYRLEVLDTMLRRLRTVHEAAMIAAAKAAGVGAPFIYHLSAPRATIVMEYVEGRRMKDAILGEAASGVSNLFHKLGGSVARLHGSGIMHGDLTTANVIIRDGNLVFVDFGLSVHTERIEDHAVDLRLIKETINGAHSGVAAPATEGLFDGYREVVGERRADAVQRQLREIERRGRYARVE